MIVKNSLKVRLQLYPLPLLPGFPVTCCEEVRVCVGPVMGEVTEAAAVILLEVKRTDEAAARRSAVRCDLYRAAAGDTEPAHTLELALPSRQPRWQDI